MSPTAFVLYINTSNSFKHIIQHFNKQSYSNKKLVIFDSINTTKPDGLPSNVIYESSSVDVDAVTKKYQADKKPLTDKLTELTSGLSNKMRFKTELEKSTEKLKAFKPTKKKMLDDEDLTIKTKEEVAEVAKNEAELKKQTAAYDTLVKEIAQMTALKASKESEIKALDEQKEIDLKPSASFAFSPDDCKKIAIEKYNADMCLFMSDQMSYTTAHITSVVDNLSTNTEGVTCCAKLLLYNQKNSKLTNRIINPGMVTNNPTVSFTKEFGSKTNIDEPLTVHQMLKSNTVMAYDTELARTCYKKIDIMYSHKKRMIIERFA